VFKLKNISQKLQLSVLFGKIIHLYTQFDVFLTVHHSIDFFEVTNLMHNSFIL